MHQSMWVVPFLCMRKAVDGKSLPEPCGTCRTWKLFQLVLCHGCVVYRMGLLTSTESVGGDQVGPHDVTGAGGLYSN